MRYIVHHQGPWSPTVGTDASPIDFQAPNGGSVLILGQATVAVDNTHLEETVGVRFRVFDGPNEMAMDASRVRLQFPNHGAVPVTYLKLETLIPGQTYRVAIDVEPGTHGAISGEDYFSVAVVELEHLARPMEEK